MEFWLCQTSELNEKRIVENHDEAYLGEDGLAKIKINSLEELLQFVKKYDTEVVIGDCEYDGVFYLEHYDSWRE